MYDNTGHLSLASRSYASTFPVEFNKEMSAVISSSRGEKVPLKNMRQVGSQGGSGPNGD